MSSFGLIGKSLGHSFSAGYFTEQFAQLDLDHSYQNFEIQEIEEMQELWTQYPDLKGLNVTIPYKELVIPLLDELDDNAMEIGAVNTIKRLKDGRLKGFNTDSYGFQQAISPLIHRDDKKALVLGTGGASKAVVHALKQLNIEVTRISRQGTAPDTLHYDQVSPDVLAMHQLVINTTPLGTYPDIESSPPLPYEGLHARHLLFDLVYNPPVTQFLEQGRKVGCRWLNGLGMLEHQADKAWEIWNDPTT